MQVRVIIPSYNEAETLGGLLRDIDRVLRGASYSYQAVVVDDGSTDRTAEVMETLPPSVSLRLVRHPRNLGVQEVFRSGFSSVMDHLSEEDVVVVAEGDGTNDPSLFPAMLHKIASGADLVGASRFLSGGGYENFPLFRHFLSLAANWIYRTFFPIPNFSDYTIFYRAYRGALLRRAWAEHKGRLFESRGFAANVDLLLKVRPFVRTADQVPHVYRYGTKRGQSKMRVLRNIMANLSLLLKHRSNLGK